MVGEEEGSVLLVVGWRFGLEEVGRSFDQSWSGWEEARKEEEQIAGLERVVSFLVTKARRLIAYLHLEELKQVSKLFIQRGWGSYEDNSSTYLTILEAQSYQINNS